MKASSGRLKKAPKCPRCRTGLDGWTGMKPGTAPRPGDVTVCALCSTVLQFTKGLGLKRAPAEVIAEVTFELSRAQRIVKKAREGAKKKNNNGGKGED